jgi:hypothetical protein
VNAGVASATGVGDRTAVARLAIADAPRIPVARIL